MADCHSDKACEIEAFHSRQSAVLKIVLCIDAVMFAVRRPMPAPTVLTQRPSRPIC